MVNRSGGDRLTRRSATAGDLHSDSKWGEGRVDRADYILDFVDDGGGGSEEEGGEREESGGLHDYGGMGRSWELWDYWYWC